MGEERKKEASRELAEEKTRPLIESEQDPKDTLLPVEKSGERKAQSIRNVQSGRKKLGILAVIVVVLAALAVGLGIYNKPENRLARQLDLGERYLDEQNYAEAVLVFEKAIQIDERCMAAYVNGIEAYRHLDEPEKLLAFYEKALEAARSLEGEDLAMDMDAVVSIYLAAEDVYADREALIALWEEGYEKSGQDGRVRDGLVRVYLARAEERASDGAYEESLQDYDRLLELDGQNETVLESLTESLKSYLDFLLGEGNFDRVRELAEKYASALPDFDFAYYLDEADRLEQERQMEELRSQLELPFTAENVTLFGYALTEDHFDEKVALLDLEYGGRQNGNDFWYLEADDESYHIDADKYITDTGKNGKTIAVAIQETPGSRLYWRVIDNTVWDFGQNHFQIHDKGLDWLQNHYAGTYNLPLISCMGGGIEDWYRSIPAEKIKEIGEYHQETSDGMEYHTWIVREPVEVRLSEWEYNKSSSSDLIYWYSNGWFSIRVVWDSDGMIYHIEYIWDQQ